MEKIREQKGNEACKAPEKQTISDKSFLKHKLFKPSPRIACALRVGLYSNCRWKAKITGRMMVLGAYQRAYYVAVLSPKRVFLWHWKEYRSCKSYFYGVI